MLDTIPTSPDLDSTHEPQRGGGGENPTGGVGETLHSDAGNFSANDLLPEHLVAADLGLTRQAVGAIRRDHAFIELTDWKKEGRAIVWTPEGRARLARLLGTRAPEKKEGPARHDLTVVRRVTNPRIVLASDGTRCDLRVRVRDATNLRASMILTGCLPVDPAHGLYEFTGRMPRRPGRW